VVLLYENQFGFSESFLYEVGHLSTARPPP